MTQFDLSTSGGVFVRIVTIDDTTNAVVLQDASANAVMDLEAHESRHIFGGADALSAGGIDRTQIGVQGLSKVDSSAPTPGVSSAYGTAVTVSADTNKSLFLQQASITIGGTVGTAETVTVQFTVNFNVAAAITITKAFTAVGGPYFLSADDLAQFMVDSDYVTSIAMASMSSLTATSATTTINTYCLNI